MNSRIIALIKILKKKKVAEIIQQKLAMKKSPT